jgi:hypothetical protein
MAKLSRDLSAGNLHPRENLFISGTIGALNAEVITNCDGCPSIALDLRGTFVATIEVAGTIDGTNWTLIPLRPLNIASVVYLAAATAAGFYQAECAGFKQVRARCTAYTSGAATTTLLATTAFLPDELKNNKTTNIVTAVGASGAAVTCTLPAPGAGLRQYLTYLSINRFAAALLVAAAAPVTVTSTNIPGTLAFSFPAEAAAQGTMDRWREDFAYPVAGSAQNTAMTIVCPVTTNVIWRVTAGYFIAP